MLPCMNFPEHDAALAARVPSQGKNLAFYLIVSFGWRSVTSSLLMTTSEIRALLKPEGGMLKAA